MAELTRSQIFFWVLTSFIGGVFVRSFVGIPDVVIWTLFVFAAFLGVLRISAPADGKRFIVCSSLIFAFALGMFRHLQKTETAGRELDRFIGEKATLIGVIDDEPKRAPASQQIVIKIPEFGNRRLLLVSRPFPEFRYGDELKIFGTISLPENFSVDFDYRSYLARDDIFYIVRFPEIERIGTDKGNVVYRRLFALKRTFGDKIQKALPEPEAAFIGGLILGERRAIPGEITDAFRRTGTGHIVALSGYNITIVASSFMRLLGMFFLPMTASLWIAAAGIILFTLLTGASASVVRASLMGLLVLFAQKSGRVYHMRNALILAGAAMVFHNPAVLRFDASFQLSFLATLGLLYGAPIIDCWFEKAKRRLRVFSRNIKLIAENRDPFGEPRKSFLREIFVSTLAAQIFVLPLLIYNFGALSFISPVANIFVLPFIPLTMFLGFITGAAGFVLPPFASIFGWAAWLVSHLELSAITFFAHFSGASVEVGKFAVVPLLILYGWVFWKLKRGYRHPG